MPKMKKVYTECGACKGTVQILIPTDIAEGHDHYPFEYIDLHGSPEHALMLFLDRNLQVRGTKVYADLKVARKEGKQYESLNRMSDVEILALIYNDPIRFKIFTALTEGPKTDADLIKILKNENGFQENAFSMLIMPFIRADIVKVSWLRGNSLECYYLVRDFLAIRIPAILVTKKILKSKDFKEIRGMYLSQQKEVLSSYKGEMLSGLAVKNRETRLALKYLNEMDYRKTFRELRYEPLARKKALELLDEHIVDELVLNKFLAELKVNGEIYYALLCDVKIEKFEPKYIIPSIVNQVNNKEITREMALTHLDLLLEAKYP